ncbi:aminotransferase class I/II-fold pyridoxal phosphate-dependent enzyme [Lacticigenium naphthae]|uniref:aminotransferase class I/II-fold pyridoxal phosphate-dependent enzyme n=1 Tax=Lacticigenium naphthae TaxID=515351 RepID=UPI00040FD075|nr:aminotransferase class I/II-fold pyridoxal phosphate-dependent enzyme [Lacticigenium naphthae]
MDTLNERIAQLEEIVAHYESLGLNLSLTRGLPSPEQLRLSAPLLTALPVSELISEDNLDVRNYGGLSGIKEARELFGSLLHTTLEETFVGGNSSLQLMYAALSHHLFTAKNPWNEQGPVKFLCPSPGYDRHWAMLDYLGIEMIPVPLTGHGPDMDVVEKLVADDPAIKGMFVVPKYNNPTGESVSDAVVDRLAQMPTAAADFLLFWDNAYTVHHLTDEKTAIKDILQACKAAGNPNRVIHFVSSSKMTFPGAGVAAMGAATEKIAEMTHYFSKQIISFDKINQKRHVMFLKDDETIAAHMAEHAAILAPKFELIQTTFTHYFQDDLQSYVKWTAPKGGYFVHLTTQPGCATAIVEQMHELGVALTPANAAYPYGDNPLDNSIRLAPTYISLKDLQLALTILCSIIERVTLEKQTSQ